MEEVDLGHEYLLDSYDGGDPIRLTFMKREGTGYPGNVGHHPGTNVQEVLRACIKRVNYLRKQATDYTNHQIVDDLRDALLGFEVRAAKRHGREFPLTEMFNNYGMRVEDMTYCKECGHIGCEGNHEEYAISSAKLRRGTSEGDTETRAGEEQTQVTDSEGK